MSHLFLLNHSIIEGDPKLPGSLLNRFSCFSWQEQTNICYNMNNPSHKCCHVLEDLRLCPTPLKNRDPSQTIFIGTLMTPRMCLAVMWQNSQQLRLSGVTQPLQPSATRHLGSNEASRISIKLQLLGSGTMCPLTGKDGFILKLRLEGWQLTEVEAAKQTPSPSKHGASSQPPNGAEPHTTPTPPPGPTQQAKVDRKIG